MLVAAGNQLAPIVSEARVLEQFVAPDFERLCALAATCGGAGTTIAAGLFRDLDPVALAGTWITTRWR